MLTFVRIVYFFVILHNHCFILENVLAVRWNTQYKIPSHILCTYYFTAEKVIMHYIQLRLPSPDGQRLPFDSVFKKYYAYIRKYANSFIDNLPLSEEIAIDSLMKVYKKKEFDDEENVKSFLLHVTRNACLDILKGRKRKEPHIKDFNYVTEKFVPGPNFPERQAMLELEFYKGLRKEIEQISHSCKQITALRFLEGKSVPEIAEMLSCSPQYVRRQQKTCAQILKDKFGRFIDTGNPFNTLIFIFITLCLGISINAIPALLKKIFLLFCF